jgi:unsaturated rhamnogalacturonyl hydrolase
MEIWKDSFAVDGKQVKWSYDIGVVLKGFEGLWLNTGDVRYYQYLKTQMDYFVQEDGTIPLYDTGEYNIDHINNGKLLLTLYRVTLQDKYLKAANLLRKQLKSHPRTRQGSFWHKAIYPHQVWLDGLYMAQPFYAEYAMLAHEDAAFDDIANQFVWIEQHTRDESTGLLYHGWDESKGMKWADPNTGVSPLFWARAMGWYATALVDVLDYFPTNHSRRQDLLAILNRLVDALAKQQDVATGLWRDILAYDGPGKEKNYLEASASAQFIYTIAKGVRLGHLDATRISIAQRGYQGMLDRFLKTENGRTNLHGTVKVSGLGGNPYRDGSFGYYMSEPVIVNDPKGIGAFLLASNEMELMRTLANGKRRLVVMDNYFNRETKKDSFGKEIVHHYKWNERDNGGFSFLGHIFHMHGMRTTLLDEGPTDTNLADASVYFLVDPDVEKENPHPNFIEKKHIEVLVRFVKRGGVLILLANDSNNTEFTHFNELSARFGIKWDGNMRHDVINNQFEQGAVFPGSGNPVFTHAKKVFIKQLSTQTLRKPAGSILTEKREVVMSVSRLGKGMVFAVGDPWFYNEYVDGRKLPAEYQNYQAATDLVEWIIKQLDKK